MGLTYCTDTAAADWLVCSATPPQQLIEFGPAGYEAYARLRFLPDPSWPGQAEADVEVPDEAPLTQVRRVLDHLAGFTASPDECYFCVWEGISGNDLDGYSHGPMVTVPHRRYVMFTGRVADFASWATDFPHEGFYGSPPAFVWPADHRWCFA